MTTPKTVRPPRIFSTPQTPRAGSKRKVSPVEEERRVEEGEGQKKTRPRRESVGIEDGEGVEEEWDLLLSKTFTLHRCTPLYDFRSDFEGYARELKEHLTVEMEKDTGVGVEDDADDLKIGGKVVHVGFRDAGLRGWIDVSGTKPFLIEIICKPRVNGKEQSYYLVALPVPRTMSFEPAGAKRSFHPRFTAHPLLLLKCPQRLAQVLTSWLEVRFDCRTCRLRIPPSEMEGVVERWAASTFDVEADEEAAVTTGKRMPPPLEMTYTVPEQVQELRTITVTVAVEDVRRVWERLQTIRGPSLVQAIQGHFLHYARIDLSCLALTRVGTSAMYVSEEGKIKLFPVPDSRHTAHVLEWLVEIAAAGQLEP